MRIKFIPAFAKSVTLGLLISLPAALGIGKAGKIQPANDNQWEGTYYPAFLPSLLFIITNSLTLMSISLFSCSPYKKVTKTADEMFTKRWKGSTEQSVQTSMGPYKVKQEMSDGYLLTFDYSYVNIPKTANKGVQIYVSGQPSSAMNPWPNASHVDHKSAEDSVIRRLDFYFNKMQRVQQVLSIGFPDSVYYVKRKK